MLTPEQQKIVEQNRALVEACQQQYNLPPNPNIDEELLLYEFFPANSEAMIRLLIFAYKQELDASDPNKGLVLLNGLMYLQDRGFTHILREKKYFSFIGFDKNNVVIEEKNENDKAFTILDSVEIQNFFCIQNIYVENLSKYKEIYFLGENGDGKTLLLQGLVLAMKKAFRHRKAPNLIPSFDTQGLSIFTASPSIDRERKDRYAFNLIGYGVHRGRRNARDFDKEGITTLFDDDVYLRSPEEWLFKIDRLNLRKRKSIKLNDAIKMLEELLDNNVKITVGDEEVVFEERGFRIAFSQLSEGYKSVITWVVDMLSRLAENQPDAKEMKDFQGIVLVDEISLHLHPKWEFQIVKKLRGWFPNIQFIFTTHSPVNVMGASEDAIFFRLYKDEEGHTQVSEPFYASDMSHLMANSIVTSPLFDLESARMRVYDEKQDLDTSDDYLYARIHKAIAEDVAEMRKAGKKFISTEKLDEMIKKMLEQY